MSGIRNFWLAVLAALRASAPGSALVAPLTGAPDLDGWAIAERLLADLAPLDDQVPIEALSESELRVLRYLPTNLTGPEIAGELYLSSNTVKTHMRALYAKLGTHHRAETVARARDLGPLAPSARRLSSGREERPGRVPPRPATVPTAIFPPLPLFARLRWRKPTDRPDAIGVPPSVSHSHNGRSRIAAVFGRWRTSREAT